jgi:hypothetical protein
LFIITVILLFLLKEWSRWLPPIPVKSPSPEKTTIFLSGCAFFKPSAIGSARPWIALIESYFKYPDERAVQPIPESKDVLE